MRGKILSIIATLLAIAMAPAQAVDNQLDIKTLHKLIENRWNDHEPGGGAIVLENGKVIFEAYKGLRNLENQQPIGKDTIFPYASITKRFTATTILSLFEDKKIDLNAPIRDYLAEIDGPMGAVTVRQLLTHSGGIPGNFKADFDKEYSTKDHLEYISALTLEFEPGTKTAYSNNGYDLLGAIIESVTGKFWYDIVHEEIIRPTGLSSIQYLQDHIDQDAALVTGYWERLDKYPLAAVKTPTFLHANAAMAGTLPDLAHWVHKFHRGDIITADTLQIAYERRRHPDGKSGWPMGLFIGNIEGEAFMLHDGGANGINTASIYIPGRDIVIVTGTTVPQDATDAAFSIFGCLIDYICNPFKAIEPPEDTLKAALGTYVYEDGKKEKLFLSSGSLFMQYENQRPLRVLYAGDNTYFIKRRRHWFTLSEGEDGKTLFSFHERGRPTANVAIKE